jgi:endopeptidase Clp ATP-binding regulatory subunit ClpX
MSEKKPSKPEDIQKEFEDFFKDRFGGGVNIFTSAMGQRAPDEEKKSDVENSSPFNLDFEYTPKAIKAYLDRFVIKQDDAKKALAIAVCDHYNHAKIARDHKDEPLDYAKQNVLVLGPTGVGKTYLIRKIADLIGVPFVKADATRFSETGYMGANVDDLVRDLVHQADGDIERAQFGIVYLDEADKLASSGKTHGRDVTGRGVQFGLLRLMEETEVDLRSGGDMQSQMQALFDMQKGNKSSPKVNTRHILFIVSGAFSGLEELIKKRINQKEIGFQGKTSRDLVTDDALFEHVTTQDFIDYGFEPEFIGRLPVRVACSPLKSEDLYQVLRDSEGSIVRQYVRSFAAYGITLDVTDDALHAMSELAVKEGTGARALMTVCDQILRDFKYELPSSKIKTFAVTRETVQNPKGALSQLLSLSDSIVEKHADIVRFEHDFKDQHGIDICFDDELAAAIEAQSSADETTSIYEFSKSLLEGYEHGLTLIAGRCGERSFTLPKKVIEDPKAYLEDMITTYFSRR